jgi:hypothetical protein
VCLPDGLFLIEEVFRGPTSYVGMPQTDDSVSHVGHLNIWSIPRAKLDAAGVMLEWSVAGIVYAVSVHTDTPVNRSLALFIAQHLVLVEPSG